MAAPLGPRTKRQMPRTRNLEPLRCGGGEKPNRFVVGKTDNKHRDKRVEGGKALATMCKGTHPKRVHKEEVKKLVEKT